MKTHSLRNTQILAARFLCCFSAVIKKLPHWHCFTCCKVELDWPLHTYTFYSCCILAVLIRISKYSYISTHSIAIVYCCCSMCFHIFTNIQILFFTSSHIFYPLAVALRGHSCILLLRIRITKYLQTYFVHIYLSKFQMSCQGYFKTHRSFLRNAFY